MKNIFTTILFSLLIVVLASAIFLPRLARVRYVGPPEYFSCYVKLIGIGKAMLNYAKDNNEAYPDSFDDLLGAYLEPNDLICPLTNNKPQPELPVCDWSSYVLVHHNNSEILNSPNHPSDIIVAYCPPENHPDNNAHVLLSGLSIQRCNKDEFLRLLKEQDIKYDTNEKTVNQPN